jgi:hypothetical protein
MIEITALLAVLYVLARAVSGQGTIAREVGNAASALADGGSDNDAIVSGMNYYVFGFTKNYGLPERAGPKGKLWIDDPTYRPDWSAVYVHYPPGANWMTGIGFYLFGPGHVPLYRSIPIAVSAVCFLASYFFIRRTLGALLAAISIIVLLRVPMTTSMMHALYSHGYATAILVLQTSYVFSCFRQQGFLQPRQLALVFLMGWMQGWLTFDYAFVASLYPLVVAAICFSRPVSKAGIITTIAAGGGFTAAHVLHFLQVALYRQSWSSAYSEFLGTAAYRTVAMKDPETPENATLQIIYTYLIELLPGRGFGDWPALYIIGVGVLMPVAYMVWSRFLPNLRGTGAGGRGLLCAVALALGVSMMWELVMQQHALVAAHKLFLPRHLIFFLFVCILSSSTIAHDISICLWYRFFDTSSRSRQIVRSETGNPGDGPRVSIPS